jgi:hypothetical protein
MAGLEAAANCHALRLPVASATFTVTPVFSCLHGAHACPLCPPPCAGHPLHEQARQLLDERNPNAEKNSNNGLVGLERRWVLRCGAAGRRALMVCHLCCTCAFIAGLARPVS